jgi:hypothetical protein
VFPVRTTKVLGTVAVAAGLTAAFLRFRRWHHAWGATDDEVTMPMAGDELVLAPSFAPTRAITIDAPPEAVWPWLVQIGYGRAGFYSYDVLDNLGRGRSADHVVPGLQDLAVGDWIPMAPNVTEETAFRVHSLEPGRSMVWAKPASTWSWQLSPLPGGRTRLVARLRQRYRWNRPQVVADLLLMELADFFMMRKELLSIRERAETAAPAI